MKKAITTIIFTCDRCNERVENPHLNTGEITYTIPQTYFMGDRYAIDLKKELCQSCCEDFLKWMAKK